jgi:hypothetical protein
LGRHQHGLDDLFRIPSQWPLLTEPDEKLAS